MDRKIRKDALVLEDANAAWRLRLRFRVRPHLNLCVPTHSLSIAGKDVILCAEEKDVEIAESEWLILSCRGFVTGEEARDFGSALKGALELAAVVAGVGLDAGNDRADLMFSEALKAHYFKTEGSYLRDSVHGLDVFPDSPETWFMKVNSKGTLLTPPEPLLTNLDTLFEGAAAPSERVRTALTLLNSARMLIDPTAQVVVAIATVEFLSQGEKWTLDQKKILRAARESVENCGLGTPLERREVLEAIGKMHRLSVRQGVQRLLYRLGLSDLASAWDDLYGDRSDLFHGAKPEAVSNTGELAHRAHNLCRLVLLRALALENPAVERIIDSRAS